MPAEKGQPGYINSGISLEVLTLGHLTGRQFNFYWDVWEPNSSSLHLIHSVMTWYNIAKETLFYRAGSQMLRDATTQHLACHQYPVPAPNLCGHYNRWN